MRKGLFILAVACLSLSISIGATPPQAASTPQERAQWVEITRKLETNLLDTDLDKQGERAVNRLSDVHDVHVVLCPSLLFELDQMKYPYAHALRRQFMLASAAFVIENPDKVSGKLGGYAAQNLVAMGSVLKAYRSIIEHKPNLRYKLLDNLLEQESSGKLPDYLQKKCP